MASSSWQAFLEGNKKLDAMRKPGGAYYKLQKFLDSAELVTERAKELHKEVVKDITPDIHAALAQGFGASDIHSITQQLQRHTTGAEVIATTIGIKIRMRGGLDKKFYVRANSLQYGAVRNSNSRPKTKAREKKLAASLGVKKMGGSSYIPPHKYFTVESLNVEEAYHKAFQIRVDKLIARGR